MNNEFKKCQQIRCEKCKEWVDVTSRTSKFKQNVTIFGEYIANKYLVKCPKCGKENEYVDETSSITFEDMSRFEVNR